MNPLLASARYKSGLDPVERALLSFEEEWQERGEVRLEEFWPDRCRADAIGPGDSIVMLAELIKADLRARFEMGQRPTVASYLEQFPQLCQTDSRVVSLIYEEFCLMEEGGRAPDVASFCDRYSRWRDSLTAQLQYHRFFSLAAGSRPPVPQFPNVGECFEEFELASLLGRGGTSRVFLARDLSLGGKQVVLKVSPDRGDEPKVHGRLDHPHIVPANSVAFQPEKHLRGLSMPHRPGLALDVVLSRLNSSGGPRKAIELWHALVDGAAKSLISGADSQTESLLVTEMRRAGPRGDGWEGFPVRGTFAEGAAWLTMIIARALHYAHGMGTYHRDVKPGNVLLTLRYGPQLFDFNLAESPHSVHQAHEAIHGGTLPYMAPEQIEAFLNPELWGDVGARADIYSLGLVLRELLTGQMPELPDEKLSPPRAMRQILDRRALLETSLRRINAKVPHALDAIVTKCLALSPDDRYRDANALAQDLERFLNHQPLLYATNPSSRERLTNWGRRHRWILLSATANLILLGALVRRPVMDQFRPPVQSRPEFLTAVALLDSLEEKRRPAPALRDDRELPIKPKDWEERDSAIRSLESLLPDYAEHPLVRTYLAIGYDEVGETRRANAEFRKLLSCRDRTRVLGEWNAKHSDLAAQLQRFAAARIQEAEEKVATEVLTDEEESEYLGVRKRNFELASGALRILDALRRDSPELQTFHARVEAFCGDYYAALTRLSRAIAIAAETEAPQNDPDDNWSLDTLFACHAIRCRIAVRWVDHSRRDGSLADARTGLELLRKTEEQDLKFCERFLGFRSPGWGSPRFKIFELLKSRLGLKLTQAELELGLGMLAATRTHLEGKGGVKETKKALSDWAVDSGLRPPKMEQVTERLRVALKQLNLLEAGETARASPAQGRKDNNTSQAG